jgi:sec-independent protein translocase protein TatC
MSGDIEDKPQPLIEHLMELRTRLMWSIGAFFAAFIVCFIFAKHLFNALVFPYKWAVQWAHLDVSKAQLIYTAPQEFFFTQVKVAMFGGLVIAFPIIAGQIYKFVAPGLYKNERSAFLPFLIASPILFLMGAALVYFFFTPMVMWFFLTMQQAPGEGDVAISLMPKVSEYLSLIMTLVFSFGLVFQLPVITTLLARVGLLTSAMAAREAQVRDRHGLRCCGRADAARSDVPDRSCAADHHSLRDCHLRGTTRGTQARQRCGQRG